MPCCLESAIFGIYQPQRRTNPPGRDAPGRAARPGDLVCLIGDWAPEKPPWCKAFSRAGARWMPPPAQLCAGQCLSPAGWTNAISSGCLSAEWSRRSRRPGSGCAAGERPSGGRMGGSHPGRLARPIPVGDFAWVDEDQRDLLFTAHGARYQELLIQLRRAGFWSFVMRLISNCLLALDTSTRTVGLALYNGAQVLSETTWTSQDYHTVELAPAVCRGLCKSRYRNRRAWGRLEWLPDLALSPGCGWVWRWPKAWRWRVTYRWLGFPPWMSWLPPSP